MFGIYAGHKSTTLAHVRILMATWILMETASIRRLRAACTTPAASVTLTTRRHTPTRRASTSTDLIPTDAAITLPIICVIITGFTVSAITEGIIDMGTVTEVMFITIGTATITTM